MADVLQLSLSEMADFLERSGDYRVLRRLNPRPVLPRTLPTPAGTRIAVILDTETTGLNHRRDEIIELGMVAFTYLDGVIGDVIASFSGLREPTVEVSGEITRITGITPEMVAGQVIDLDEVAAFIEEADLIIAHNAKFDRAFCERFAPGSTTRRGPARSRKSIGQRWASKGPSSAISSASVDSFTMDIALWTTAMPSSRFSLRIPGMAPFLPSRSLSPRRGERVSVFGPREARFIPRMF